MPAGRPRAFETVDALEEGITAYYAECLSAPIMKTVSGVTVEIPEPLSVSGLAHSLGVDRSTLHAYAAGEYDDDEREYSYTIKKAITKIERDKVSRAMLGIYDKTVSIFDLKNNHGWKDKTEVDNTHKGDIKITKVERTVVNPKHRDS